jgi:hypothetical protein
VQEADRGRGGFQLGREQDAAHRPDGDEEEAATGPEHELGIGLHRAEDAVEGAVHPVTNRRPLEEAPHQKGQDRRTNEQLEVRTENVLEIARLPRDVEGAEPFDMRARIVCPERIRQDAARRRARQPPWPQTHHASSTRTHTRVTPPHAVTRYN